MSDGCSKSHLERFGWFVYLRFLTNFCIWLEREWNSWSILYVYGTDRGDSMFRGYGKFHRRQCGQRSLKVNWPAPMHGLVRYYGRKKCQPRRSGPWWIEITDMYSRLQHHLMRHDFCIILSFAKENGWEMIVREAFSWSMVIVDRCSTNASSVNNASSTDDLKSNMSTKYR